MGSRLGTSVVLGLALAGCGGSAPRPAAAPAASLATRAEDAVHVSFYARTKERWTLRSAQGGILCPLPCAGWVGAEAGLVLVEDDFLVDGQPVTFPVPSQLPAVAGEDLVVTVDRTHAWGTKKVGFPRGAVVRPLWPAPAFRRSSAVPGLARGSGLGFLCSGRGIRGSVSRAAHRGAHRGGLEHRRRSSRDALAARRGGGDAPAREGAREHAP